MIGQTIRKFEIQSELGAGGYGAVYRAHDTDVDRDVAIKVILPQYAENSDFKQRFESEARLVAQLESPRIVPLYDFWQDEQGAFLVMRFIRGGSLRRIMAKQDALSLSQTMRIVSDIAEALVVAHENGVVHRDLKPENILIDERGNAYLTDFGIAKRTSDAENITDVDAIVGTWAYLSPEQIQNADVSPQTDIYAFGILLYELLAGKHPFQGTPATMMVMKHLQEPLPDLSEARPDLPRQIDDIIGKATAKDSVQRYASTLDMVAELKQSVGATSLPSTAPQIQPRKKATSPKERNRMAMLDNVRTFWIEGVLENSLHDAAMIDLGMKPESGAVDNPWDTLIRTSSGDDTLYDESIINVSDRMNGKLLILGDPGSGKTTTLLTLARDLLLRAEMDEQHPIPVVFNLSSWSENQPPLTEWLVEELNGKYQVPRKVAQQWIEDDELLLLLDGLDEVAESVRDACVKAINMYRSEHGFVDVVVCSRIKDYEALTGQLRLNGAIVIQPLNDSQIVQYLDALGADVAIVRELITRDAQLRELAESPLMLSIMVLAYRGKTADDIPDFDNVEAQRQHLFDVYVERMFERRVGEILYSKENTQHYLRWLANKMQEHAKTVFNIEDLQPAYLLPRSRKQYNRTLRLINSSMTLGFYLLASWLLTLVLPVDPLPFTIGQTLIGLLIGWLLTLDRRIWKHFLPYLLIGIFGAFTWAVSAQTTSTITLIFVSLIGFSNNGIAGYLVGVIFDRMNNGIDEIHTKELVKVSLKDVRLSIAFVGLLTSIGPTLMMASWVNPNGGWFNWLLGAILSGLGYSVLLTIATSLVSSDMPMRVTPNQGIRRSLQTAFRTLAIMMPFFIIAFILASPATTFRITLGITLGFSVLFGQMIWWAYGGFTYIQHQVLRASLHRGGYLPRDLVRFLDYAASLILLRKVGGGYIFIHRYLLEYFAEPGE